MTIDNKTLYTALKASLDAGKVIMHIYREGFSVDHKADGSPLTMADRASNDIILSALEKTNLPVISEEKPLPSYTERASWENFWLVDPLDGTKEFVNHNDEFTVNIALIYKNTPVFGVLTAPALNLGYIGLFNSGAYKIPDLKKAETLSERDFLQSDKYFQKLSPLVPAQNRIIAASRSHINDGNMDIISKLFGKENSLKTIYAGSALKFGLLAEGKAHFYLRNDKIWEWDTAAGHAILIAAGGSLMTWPDGSDLKYNKKVLKNPGFVACASKDALELLKAKLSL